MCFRMYKFNCSYKRYGNRVHCNRNRVRWQHLEPDLIISLHEMYQFVEMVNGKKRKWSHRMPLVFPTLVVKLSKIIHNPENLP